jgi:hypothetical protein
MALFVLIFASVMFVGTMIALIFYLKNNLKNIQEDIDKIKSEKPDTEENDKHIEKNNASPKKIAENISSEKSTKEKIDNLENESTTTSNLEAKAAENKTIKNLKKNKLEKNLIFREKYLIEIDTMLSQKSIAIISGISGIGKTQLALTYISQREDNFEHILYLNAEHKSTLLSDYADYFKKPLDENISNEVIEWTKENDNWLFIYDNVNDKKVLECLKESCTNNLENGKIIILTQLENLEEKILLKPFEEKEAYEYINMNVEDAPNSIKNLIRELHYFPLALNHAVCFMKIYDVSCKGYMKIFKRAKYNSLIENNTNPYLDLITKTWQISVDKIGRVSIVDFMSIISCLSTNNIELIIFENGKTLLPKILKKDMAHKIASRKLIKSLEDHGLISQNLDSFSVNKIIQESVMLNIDKPKWIDLALNLIKKSLKFNFVDKDKWKSPYNLVPHAIKVASYGENLNITNDTMSFIFSTIANINKSFNNIEEVEYYYLKALNIREREVGKEHTSTGILYYNLGTLYKDMEKYEESLEFLIKALNVYEKRLGKNHLDTAILYENIADVKLKLENYSGKDIETLFLKVLDIRKNELGEEHPDTISIKEKLDNLTLV